MSRRRQSDGRNVSLQVLEEHHLLCRKYQRNNLDDVFEPNDWEPDPAVTHGTIMSKKAKYLHPILPIFAATHLEMSVEPMHIGLVMDEHNNYLLAKPGIHLVESMFCRNCGEVDINSKRSIAFGNRHVVLVEDGCVGLAWDDGQPVLLPGGYHAWTSDTMTFEKQMPLDLDQVRLGPYTLVTVTDGYAAVTNDLGATVVLDGGRPYVLTHAMWTLEYFLPLHVQTDAFFSKVAVSADNVQMAVRANVVWKVADPWLVKTNLTLRSTATEKVTGPLIMKRLKNNVIKQALACISKFTAMVNYCDTFHASAAFAADQQAVRGSAAKKKASTDNPFFDSVKLSKTLGMANAITTQYGVQVIAIDVVEATPRNKKLRNVLTVGAQASADALQLARVRQGEADARLVVEQSKATEAILLARGKADAMVIEASGDADAMVVEAMGHMEAAKKLGNNPLTFLLEKMRISNEILAGGEKLIMTQHTDKSKDPNYVYEIRL